MAYFKNGAFVDGIQETVSSGGVTTLVNNSKQCQVITGTSAHTVKLPDSTTMSVGQSFEIVNESTGDLDVQNDSGSTIDTVKTGESRIYALMDNSTANGDFDITTANPTASFTHGDLVSLAAAQAGSFSEESKKIKLDPEAFGADFWKLVSSLQNGRMDCAGLSITGYGYVVGGAYNIAGSSLSDENTRYDEDGDIWLSRAVFPYQSFGATGIEIDGFGYLIGGSSGTNVQKYNTDSDSWSSGVATPGGGIGGCGRAVISNLGHIYGYVGALGGHYSYNATNDAFTVRSDLINASQYGASFLLDSFAYFCGGYTGGYIADSRKYDAAIDAWRSVRAMGLDRSFAVGFVSSGFAYAATGERSGTPNMTRTEKYNSTYDTWVQVSDAVTSTSDHNGEGFTLNERGHIIGGSQAPSVLANVQQYRNAKYFYFRMKKSRQAPSVILASVKIKDLSVTVPVQLRTDGSNWKNFVANKDNALRSSEDAKSKFKETSLLYAAGGGDNVSTSYDTQELYNETHDAWVTKAVMPATQEYGTGFSTGGKGYVVSANLWEYDEDKDAWLTKAAPTASGEMCPAFVLDGFAYIQTSGTNATYEYDPTLDTWSTVGNALVSYFSRGSFALPGFGYAVGGDTNGSHSVTDRVDRYSRTTDSWVNVANLPSSREQIAGQSLYGFGYATNGYTGSSSNTNYKYDQGTNAWSTKTVINFSAYGSQGQNFGGYAYVLGGFDSSAINSTSRYNDAADSWASRGTLNTARYGAAMHGAGPHRNYELKVGIPAEFVGLGGSVWVTRQSLNGVSDLHAGWPINGSIIAGSAPQGPVTQIIETYDEESDSWSNFASFINTVRATFSAMTFHGFGYAVGGFDGSHIKTVEKLDFEKRIFTSVASVANNKYSGSGFGLNGYGWAVGSFDNTVLERYSDALDSWSSKATSTVVNGANGCAALHGYGYIFGATSTAVQSYNDQADAWTTKTSMGTSRFNLISFVVNERLYASSQGTSEYYRDEIDAWVVGPALNDGGGMQSGQANIRNTGYRVGGGSGSGLVVEALVNSEKQLVLGIALKLVEV